MSQTGFTPIQLYRTTTASAVPLVSNLADGELAINTNDGKLYYKDSSGAVQVIATKATVNGVFTTLSASSTVSGTGFTTYLASPPPIGGTVSSTGAFTTLTASSGALVGVTGGGSATLHIGGSPTLVAGSANAVQAKITYGATVAFAARGFWSNLSLGAAITVGELVHYEATQGSVGSGSSINFQYGFRSNSNLSDGNYNTAFFAENVTLASGKTFYAYRSRADISALGTAWNIYADGTAPSYFVGNIGIGTTSADCALDVVGGIKTSRTGVTAPAATDGNVFSGSYTAAQVGTNTNVASVTFGGNFYMRVGNMVTVIGTVVIDATALNTDTTLRMSLPIASNFTTGRQLGGTGNSINGGVFGTISAAILADTTNNCAEFRLRPNSTSSLSYQFSFTYNIA
jgi:hypothetical protein